MTKSLMAAGLLPHPGLALRLVELHPGTAVQLPSPAAAPSDSSDPNPNPSPDAWQLQLRE